MLSKDLFNNFMNKVSNSIGNNIMIDLFKIYNNVNILIQCKLNIYNTDNNIIYLSPKLYICKEQICLYCTYFQDNNNISICDCNVILDEFNIYFNEIKITKLKNETNENIYVAINEIINKNICEKLLSIINNIKYCDNCNTIINNNCILCDDCKWQKVYNIKYGIKLNMECSIYLEELYKADSLSICGNTNHSIHIKCKKEIKKCPICRQN